jgi:hypothetical protein
VAKVLDKVMVVTMVEVKVQVLMVVTEVELHMLLLEQDY